MNDSIRKVMLMTHSDPRVAAPALREIVPVLGERAIEVFIFPEEWAKHRELLAGLGGVVVEEGEAAGVGAQLCLVLGGDGTMLRAFHATQDTGIPVAGVNLGRVGFLTTLPPAGFREGLAQLLDGRFRRYPLLGLRACLGSSLYRAANDVVVTKGDRARACALALTINGVTLFEVLCDGVVAATPAGSSAYSLAAGGPLLGISVQAYVISLIAAHAVGVRPVVAAPEDVLDVINASTHSDCYVDIDGQRLAVMRPGDLIQVQTEPAGVTLALLEHDSLYHHFRDRLL